MSSLIPSHQLPLLGKRIIITAPRNYAGRLAQEIINSGGLPMIMSTIETCLLEEENYQALDQALKQINRFNWISFTSRQGIEAVYQRLLTLKISLSELNQCQLCAIGADASRLTELGLTVSLIPQESSPQGIVNELAKMPNLLGQEILVPVPEVVGITEPDIIPNFVQSLEQLKLKVQRVPAYKTCGLDQKLYAVELELIHTGKIDVIAFSSSAEVEAFLQWVDSPKALAATIPACFGPYTAKNAAKLGIIPAIVAQDYRSYAGFVKAIADGLVATDKKTDNLNPSF
ncbi:uroporphyrinogen-III synthase [Gloeothece verrucosa]|uniref:Uroporphyrinogen III synthase HEM4 n=1 Tax=Gloeothece verrucosa (strain PCC 7822) TaxID=497965 RepID=E0U975_GLOV7|nr:uroporphyrinogen-III synthase [Gloeothece verrucosa]ADN17333.1 Uroporphyrinogen III synthase HEM4 [Gloeothece verrucosa PCC 7822]